LDVLLIVVEIAARWHFFAARQIKSKLRKVEKVDFRKACLDKGHKKTDRTSTNDYFETSKRGFLIMFGHRLTMSNRGSN
jgi:hypothetical protein